MAKFCINCGKELKDGNPCDCQKELENGNFQSNELVSKLLEIFKGMFIKPIDTMKTYAKKEYFIISLILTGVLSVLTGLFAMGMAKGSYELVNMLMLGGSSSSYLLGTVSVEIPYVQIFLSSAIVTFGLTFAYSGILYFVNKLFKGKASYQAVYSLYAVDSIIVSVSLALATILSLVNLYLGLIVFMLGSLLNFVYIVKGIRFIGPKDENKYGYIYLSATVIYILVLFVVIKLFA